MTYFKTANLGFEQTWRWFGPEDSVPLSYAKMAGATGIVTALHHIANGEVWPIGEIEERKKIVETEGLKWSVAESVPVHEDIKKRSGRFREYIENYKQNIRNLSQANIKTICYNFMPVLDWTRTDLSFDLPDGSKALRFDFLQLAVFELFLLKRVNTEATYTDTQKMEARKLFQSMNPTEKEELVKNILAGLPGAEEGYSLKDFNTILNEYQDIGPKELRENLILFLKEIIPIAEQYGVLMAIHPDDPPFSILGLPRIISTRDDIEFLIKSIDSPHNGLCFCTGSFGLRQENHLIEMIKEFGHRINFVHLRSTSRDKFGNFYEADHLNGDVDMYGVVKTLLQEQNIRKKMGRKDIRVPIRPDHGHQMLDDLNKKSNPGYSAIGRLRGLAEIRGLEMGILNSSNF